jgi:hypothetical protein
VGLTWAIFGTFTTALFVLVFVLFIVLPQQAQGPLEDTLFTRGKAVAREIERKIVIGPREGLDQEASNEIRTIVGSEDEIRAVWVLVCQGAECEPRDLIAIKPNTDPELTRAVLGAFNAGNRRARLMLDSGDLLVSDEVQPRTGGGRGHVLILLDTARVREAIGSVRQTLLVALLISVAVFIALVGVLSRVLIIAPIRLMRAQALRLSEADLSGRIEGATTRELQDLSEALNMIGQGLRDTIGRVRGVAESVAQVIDSISRTAATTTGGSSTVLTRVEETSSAMVEMLASLRGISENIETLYGSAEDSSSSILEMATTNDEVADNVRKMAASVEQTTSAIDTIDTRSMPTSMRSGRSSRSPGCNGRAASDSSSPEPKAARAVAPCCTADWSDWNVARRAGSGTFVVRVVYETLRSPCAIMKPAKATSTRPGAIDSRGRKKTVNTTTSTSAVPRVPTRNEPKASTSRPPPCVATRLATPPARYAYLMSDSGTPRLNCR